MNLIELKSSLLRSKAASFFPFHFTFHDNSSLSLLILSIIIIIIAMIATLPSPSPHKIEKWPLCHCSLMDRTGSKMLSNFIVFPMQRPRFQTFVMSFHFFGAFLLFWEEGWDKTWEPISPFIKEGPSKEGCEGLQWRIKLQYTLVHSIWFPTSTQYILKSGLVSFRLIFVPLSIHTSENPNIQTNIPWWWYRGWLIGWWWRVLVHQFPHIETSTQTFPPPIANFTLSKIAWHWHLGFTCKEIYIKHICFMLILHKKFTQIHAPSISLQYVKIWILKLNTWFCWLSLASKKILQFRKRFVLLPVDFQNSPRHTEDQDSHWLPFFYSLSHCLYLLS